MESYEEKYKEALERAEKLYEQGTITESLNYIFPELSESEDERIRKHLISLVKNWDKDGIFSKYTSNPNDIKKILAWLEKQGEQLDKGEISDVWTKKDRIILEGIIDEIEADKDEAPSYDLPTYDKYLNWLKSLKNKIKNE